MLNTLGTMLRQSTEESVAGEKHSAENEKKINKC